MRRILAAMLLVAVVVLTAGWIAGSAYQAGLVAGSAATTTSVAPGSVVVPVHGLGWWGLGGFGWPVFGLGFGFFGLLGTLLFVFLIVGLVRFVAFGGHHGHRHGGRRRGWGGPGADHLAEWHRQAHEHSAPPAGATGGATAPRTDDQAG